MEKKEQKRKKESDQAEMVKLDVTKTQQESGQNKLFLSCPLYK